MSENINQQSDSQFSESDRAALDYARSRHKEQQHRAWLWALTKSGAKWVTVIALGITALLNTLKAVIGAIRDGL